MWADMIVQETNVGLMCPDCGEAWGRVVNTHAVRWTFQMRACSKHGGGSFIAAWTNQFDELPSEVLQYELNLLLTVAEKETQLCGPSSSSSS
ncbi:MAG: hypothetical protein Q7T59_02510 [Candidatus Woesebacteria bacterium]|nr:hypothetical protein [Candidatus Woesebacteria bacterium]